MKWFGLPVMKNDEQKRLDSICKKIFPQASYHSYMQWIRNKLIKINNHRTTHNYRVVDGDYICIAEPILVYLHIPLTSQLVPIDKHESIENTSLLIENPSSQYIYKYFESNKIIYHNNDILILNKKAGESIFHGKGAIIEKLSSIPNDSLSFKPAPCHRLDTGTSGILMCGMSIKGTRILNEIQKNSQVHKCYVALLESPVNNAHLIHHLYRNNKSGKTLALVKDGHTPLSEQYVSLGDGFLFAHSYGELSLCPSHHATQQSVYLTFILLGGQGGKTHQIRAQCLANKTPLLGDIKYSPHKEVRRNGKNQHSQFFLHASTYLLADNTTSPILPKALRCPLPHEWLNLIHKDDHELLRRLDVGLNLLADEWCGINFSDTSTDIIALCISTLGGVMG